jgi:DNA-binding beta-propeller fold protein YncE
MLDSVPPLAITISSDDSYALVTDTQSSVIRKIVISTSEVSVVAGSLTNGLSNGIGTDALFSYPQGISLSSDDIYALVTDTENSVIRMFIMFTSEVSWGGWWCRSRSILKSIKQWNRNQCEIYLSKGHHYLLSRSCR